MAKSKYTLEPLLQHRGRKVDDAKTELGSAVRNRESAAAAQVRAEQIRIEAEERAAATRAAEAKHLDRGELRAVDLMRAHGWEHAVQAEKVTLEHAVDQAEEHLDQARDKETHARVDLAQKMADRDVVVKDKDRFMSRVRRNVEAAEEEAAEEAWGGAHSHAKGHAPVRG
jgi:flagellar biosynthesis chaperone FliJ